MMDEDDPREQLSVRDDRLIDRLFRAEAPRLARFIRRNLRDGDDVHDLVQETFASFVAATPRSALRSPEAYLTTIARRLLWRLSRRSLQRSGWRAVPLDDASHLSVDPEQEWVMEASDTMRRYEQALSELPPRSREIFRLSRQEELTYHEIAERLGMTERGVKYHMRKALMYLDQRVNGDE